MEIRLIGPLFFTVEPETPVAADEFLCMWTAFCWEEMEGCDPVVSVNLFFFFLIYICVNLFLVLNVFFFTGLSTSNKKKQRKECKHQINASIHQLKAFAVNSVPYCKRKKTIKYLLKFWESFRVFPTFCESLPGRGPGDRVSGKYPILFHSVR